MARLSMNKQTALILALTAALLASPSLVTRSLASPIQGAGEIGGAGGSTGDGKGDPDVPTGPARTTTVGSQRHVVEPQVTATVGDGRMSRNSVWMWRIRIVLQSLRAYAFRF